MAGRSHLLELDSDLVLNQRLLQSLAGLMNETLGVAQDIAQYCPEAELATLRTTLAGTAGDSQGELAMTEVEINTRCPYTGCTMQDPVVNKRCGHVYDREGILAHIKQKKNKANSCLAKVYISVDQLSERIVLRTINPEHNEISHRQFQAAMKQRVSTDYPFFKKQLTPFAFAHAISELDKAVSLECELCDDCVVVRYGGERVVGDNSCDCCVFVSNCLPCHIMASLMAKDMRALDLAMFSPRWMRCNQSVTAHPAGRVNVSVQN
ncbi:E3 sumo-protein ligase nse2 [Plakobranchus ocellatus]|uniref:E3 SUMO-protein ligase NSE2 n=1 Tax=Plakobranchus ocellatus TaxID=259542 RepID=A0AAV3ZTD5_9GAST|nr:E3 sumo-protein ligase nse2 [Plakobranchus ocellatus]